MASGERKAEAVAWLWTALALAIAVVFINAAVGKLTEDADALEPFNEFGWPVWLASLTAIGEIVGSIALVIPATRPLGGILLASIMIGAGFTNIANGHPSFLWLNAVLLAGSLLLAWQGLRRRYRLSHRH